MTFRLVDKHWLPEFVDALQADHSTLRIVCPFIKVGTLDRLLKPRPGAVQAITRFNLANFADGVSDIAALRRLLESGGSIRGIRHLHAKLYVFGTTRAIITSANLTRAGLSMNHEFGVVTEDRAAVERCLAYFDALWRVAGKDLQPGQLDEWDSTLTGHLASGGRPARTTVLRDFGADAGFIPAHDVETSSIFADPPQAFVKFLGEGSNRVPTSFETTEEVRRAGCHWALAYPEGKRPRAAKDGAVMFIARLTDEPDIRIFGRAVAMRHEPGRDDATPADIERREWVSRWPHYIRVHHAQFLSGPMKNGVSLNELMATLDSRSFASTRRNAARGSGNTDPRRAYMQQAAVQLSDEAFHWLSAHLEAAFDRHGTIPLANLEELDWPVMDGDAGLAPQFTQEAFDRELRLMLEADSHTGKTTTRIIARDLHHKVVGGWQPNRMPMACNAMRKLWEQQGSIEENIIHITASAQSSVMEIEFLL